MRGKRKFTAVMLATLLISGNVFYSIPAYAAEIDSDTNVEEQNTIPEDKSDRIVLEEENTKAGESEKEVISVEENDLTELDEENVNLEDGQSEEVDTDQIEDVEIVDTADMNQTEDVENIDIETEEIKSETLPQYLAGNSLATATAIAVNGSSYSGSISDSNPEDYYKFTLSSSGRIDWNATAYMKYVKYHIFDSEGVELYYHDSQWNSVTEQSNTVDSLDLTRGTYYFVIQKYSNFTGQYKFDIQFTGAGESFSEAGNGQDNSVATANSIEVGRQYTGQIAKNDDKDYYRFSISGSGKVTLEATAHMKWIYYHIYDASGAEVYSKNPQWNSVTEQSIVSDSLELTKGTYYLAVHRDGSYTGAYSFTVKHNSAGESFTETGNGINNSMSEASSIYGNTQYAGQLAVNDDKDFYKFRVLSDGSISIEAIAYMKWIYYYIYNESGQQLFSKNPSWNSGSGNSMISESVTLSAGEYYFAVKRDGNYTGNYSFKLQGSVLDNGVVVSGISGLQIGGRAGDALRLNWLKNATANGYIIEQYKNGGWTRIARISGNATTTYRVENLTPGTTYKFRVRGFNTSRSMAVYGSYSYVNGKTNPSVISGLKIGGVAKDALRLNWTKNGTASGYIIEQYKNSGWSRIARISENTTTTYRVEKLAVGTTYKFRIMAFGYDGSTAIYGGYSYISGTTLGDTITAVSGLKIGGRAADALRLNWNKNSSVSGYIIEQYKNGAWTRIARIADNATTTYRVEKLSASVTYKFRIQAFKYVNGSVVYSSYNYINGKTNPGAMTGVTISGRAQDALRVKWNRNATASGYIVEKYSDGSWVRVARISNYTTDSYRVENLRTSSTYVFRVKAFNFDGSTPLYGAYAYTSGTTY